VRRGRSGEGATIDVTMLEALGEWMGFPALFTAYGGSAPPALRRAPRHDRALWPVQGWWTARAVFLSVQNQREFAAFCDRVLMKGGLKSDPRFATGPARFRNREAMHAEIDAVFY